MAAAVIVDGLRKRYGDLHAVDGVSFEVAAGELFGILGPNGAGRTTTLEIVDARGGGPRRQGGHPRRACPAARPSGCPSRAPWCTATVNGLLSSLVQEANLALSGRPPAYRLEARQVEDEALDTIQYLTPGLIGWAVTTGATFGSALTLVTWREKKILRRLRLAPVTVWSVVGARVGVSLVLALAQTATFLAVALLPYFGLRLDRYWWMAVPLVAAGTLAFLSLGTLAGAWARSAEAASAVANIVVLPMAFLSGALFSLEAAPAWVRGLSVVFPLRHLVDGMQQVMVRGQGPVSVLPELAVLLGFALAVSLVAFRLFRWDDT